jgi:hypothetical protein
MRKKGNLFVALVWSILLILTAIDTLKKMNTLPKVGPPVRDFSNGHP